LRVRRSLALALGLAFAAFYAATWNGRYLHDGPMFLRSIADGKWLHVHAGYLPVAHVVAWLPGVDGAGALAALAVASGVACVALSTLLAGRATDDRRVAVAAGVLIGVAPVVWAAAGMVEIHVFGGAGACLAAWIACALPGPAWRRVGLAAFVGLLAHMTNVLLVPLFVALSLERTSRDRLVRDGPAALGAAAVAVVTMHLVGRELPPKVEGASGTLPLLLRQAWSLARHPEVLADRMTVEFVRPWLLVAAAPLALLVPGGKLRVLPRLVAAVTGLAGAMLVATYIPLAGQYGLALCPVLALGVAHGLELARGRRAFVPAAVAVLVATLVLAPGEHARLAADPDRDWAEEVAPHVDAASVVLCLGQSRRMRIDELTTATAVDFQPAGDHWDETGPAVVERALAGARERGQTLYLDPEVVVATQHLEILRPVVDTLRELATLVPAADGRLLRVE
jgi:hypothetical protein